MKYPIRKALFLVVVIVGLAISVYGLTQTIPDKALRPIDGNPMDIQTVRQSAPVTVLYYWFVDCPYCEEQLGELNHLQVHFDATSLALGQPFGLVVGINVHDSEQRTAMYWAGHYTKFPTLINGQLPTAGTPTIEVYIEGQLVKRWVGLTTAEQIAAVIEQAAGE